MSWYPKGCSPCIISGCDSLCFDTQVEGWVNNGTSRPVSTRQASRLPPYSLLEAKKGGQLTPDPRKHVVW